MDSQEVNSKMLYKIADIIEAFPEHHNQDSWIEMGSLNNADADASIIWDGEKISCGTTQCIAGWAVVLDNKGLTGFQWEADAPTVCFENGMSFNHYNDQMYIEQGADILGLDRGDALKLFMTSDISDYESFDMPRVLREIADGEKIEKALSRAWIRHEEWEDANDEPHVRPSWSVIYDA